MSRFEAQYNKIIDGSQASFLVTITKAGHLEVGMNGPVDLILSAMAGGIVNMEGVCRLTFDEIGQRLNQAVATAIKATEGVDWNEAD